MSVGIGLTMPGGVLLVADGRLSLPFAPGVPPRDGVEKIHVLHAGFAVLELGIRQVTAPAVAALRQMPWPLAATRLSPDQHRQRLAAVLDSGWTSLETQLGPDADRTHPALQAALIGAGVAGRRSFLSGVLRSSGSSTPTAVVTAPLEYIVMGGEAQGALPRFGRRALHAFCAFGRGVDWAQGAPLSAMIDAAGHTIRDVQQSDRSVGGTVRFAVLRSALAPLVGVWPR